MADSILRLRVESNEYDSKIKRAQQGLLHMEEACRKAGKSMNDMDKDQKQFVQSLGSMQTVSTSVRGKIGELSGAFVELRSQYNRLTDEEKKGDFGKALSGSLEQLKTRISETKNQLADTNRELNGTPSLFDQLTSRLTVNIDAVKLFNVGLQAAGAALDVAKDAFFQSESNIDEWGRMVEGAKGAYEVFLNALNTGNWSNFFNNLSKAIQGGRELYDALDRLGSIKSNNQAAIALAQAQIQQLRVLKQQGKDVDDEIKSATQRLKELQGQSVRAGKTAGRTEIVNTLRNEVAGRNTTGVQIDDRQLRAASQRVLKEGQAYFDGMAKLVRQYEGNTKYQTTRTTYTQTGSTIGDSKAVDVTEFDLSKLSKQQQQQYLIAKAITEGETRIQVGISTFAQAVQEGAQSAREEFRGNRYALTGNGRGSSGTTTKAPAAKEQTELQKNQQLIANLTQEYQVLADRTKTASGQELVAADDRMTAIRDEIRVLQERNEELKRWADLAQGKTPQNIDVNHIAAPDPSKMGVKALPLFDFDASKSTGVSQKAVDGLVSQFQQAVQTADIDGALMQKFQTGLTDATTLSTLLKTAIEKGVNTEGMDFAGLKEQIGRGLDIPDEKFEELQNKINEKLQAMGLEPINIDFKTGNIKEAKKLKDDGDSVAMSWSNASKAVGSIGSALQSIEDPTAKVAGLVAQAVAQIAATFAASLKGTFTPWDWIAGAAAGTATMLTTISAIKSATKGGFADGGIVPGNSYSGDNLRISDYGINSGELVLNRAQTNSIAAQLTDGDGRGQGRTSSSVQISSENLRIVLHNGARARGMSVGEYLNI